MEGSSNNVVVYGLVLFLLLIYVFIMLSLVKKSGKTGEDVRKNAKAWVTLKKRVARTYLLTKEGSALVSMLLSLTALFWIVYRDLIFNNNFGIFGNMMHFWPVFLLFAVSAGLSLALKNVNGLLIALPYLLVLVEGFFWSAWAIVFPFREAGVAGRVVSQLFYALALPTAIIALLRGKDEPTKNKIYSVALAFHLIVFAGTVYYYTYHYGVRHLAEEPVSVERLRLGDGELGFPLVEEDAAYIVNWQGRLYQIELAAGRKRFLAQIPRPTAAEAGFPGVILNPVTRDAASPFFREGVLTRVNSDELTYQYNHIDLVDVYVRINQNSGEISWQLKEREPIQFDLPPVYRVTEVQGRFIRVVDLMYSLDNPFTVLIKGEGINTAIDPMGLVTWTQAKHGWILVGTNRGELAIVTTDR